MGDHAYRRHQQPIAVRGTVANDVDLLEIIIPARRQLTIFGMKAVVNTKPASGAAVLVELVSSANTILFPGAFVSVSAISDGTINNTASANSFPYTVENNTSNDIYIKARMDGAQTSAGLATVQLDISSVGIKGRPA
jgi:hypothetical protein